MSRATVLLILGFLIAMPSRVGAQIVVSGGGFRAGFHSKRISVSIFAGSVRSYGMGFYTPYPIFGPPPFVFAPPVFLPPPPVVILPQPIFIQPPPLVLPPPVVVRRAPPAPVVDDPLVQFNPDQFLVIRPRVAVDRPIAANIPERPKVPPVLGLPREPKLALQPLPEADPPTEARRQIILGMEAFTAQQYGRAVERFQQAIVVTPRDHKPHALLAEAYFALGKYREAMIAIEATLLLEPDWPSRRFDPADLYGNEVAAYRSRLQELEIAIQRNPDDPTMLFLSGYHEWFGGDRAKALERLRQARERTTEPRLIERFLLAGDGPLVTR